MSARSQPAGTRDVLPDEMKELREISRSIVDVLDQAGYGEVRAPTLELEDSSPVGQLAPQSPYRMIDEHGETLVLRSDMTVPIARIAASRYTETTPPLRFSYLARAWRRVSRGSGEAREFMQAGAELLGADPVGGLVEILNVLGDVLSAAGLRDWRIGIGDSQLAGALLDGTSASEEDRQALTSMLADRDYVALDGALSNLDGGDQIAGILRRRFVASDLGQQLESIDAVGADGALSAIRETVERLEGPIKDRTIVDLGLTPRIGYYGGIVFEVYDPAFGRPIGSGGRYDRLMEAVGRPMTAFGFSLDVELVHAAITGEERGEGGRVV